MNNLPILTKIVFLSINLFVFSCSTSTQNEQVENKAVINADIEATKQSKVEVFALKNGEYTTINLTQNRDMSLYDQGGYFDCWNVARGECNENKIRDFIWQHWTEKKRGYIRIGNGTVDSMSTSHYFIEPNDTGEWIVAWRIVRMISPPGYNKTIDDAPEIISVERIENKPKKGQWALALKTRSGEIATMPYFIE